MGDGLTPGLLVAGFSVAAVSFVVLCRYLPPPAAFGVSSLKVAVPVVYFAWFHNPAWTLLDDVMYWAAGRTMLANGYDPLSALFTPDGLRMMFQLAGGAHVGYVWWNTLAQFVWGPHYYAPVLLNVGTTVLAGIGLYRIALLAGMSRRYAQGLLAFFLLHWDLLVWSSLLNVKDVLVLGLSIAALYSFLRLTLPEQENPPRRGLHFGILGGVFLLLPWIRFYAPVLLLGTFAGWMLLRLRGWKKYAIAAGSLAAMLWLVSSISIPSGLVQLSPLGMVVGAVRFLLTPQPWSIVDAASYLFFPSILHWLLVVPALAGGLVLWRRSRAASLLVVYLVVVTFFYALVPELQGPRQRMQVSFILVWFQFHAVYLLLARVAPRLAVLPSGVARVQTPAPLGGRP